MYAASPTLPPQALYDRACEYLELDSRTELLNARFEVGREGEPGFSRHLASHEEKQPALRVA